MLYTFNASILVIFDEEVYTSIFCHRTLALFQLGPACLSPQRFLGHISMTHWIDLLKLLKGLEFTPIKFG